MIVIKATLRDETRRLTFYPEGSKFPPYEEVQEKLRGIFSLPSSAHPFWVNVLFYPDDTKPSRIKFKQHVCDAAEYELAQEPFLRHSGFRNPALVFTVLLSSDVRMSSIRASHRALAGQAKLRELDDRIRALEDDLVQRHRLLVALEDKLDHARYQNDELGVSFWSDRVEDKRQGLPELEEKLRGVRADRRHVAEELELTRPTSSDMTLRQWSESQELEEVNHARETQDGLAAWEIEMTEGHSGFPPLESVLRGNGYHPQRRHPWRASAPNVGTFPFQAPPSSHPRNTPPAGMDFGAGARTLRDLFTNPEFTGAPAREMGAFLDRFLNHFQGQLADTLDGFAQRIAPHPSETLEPTAEEPNAPEAHIPGAFVQPEAQAATNAEATTPAPATERKVKPASKLGKGGFRHKHITCDGCLSGIRGTRYKCEQCPDYDLCGSCLPLLNTDALHPDTHTFKAVVHPGLEERIKFGGTATSRTPHQHSRHPATCDICSEIIVGVRWKCLNCPDWDCCTPCSKLIADVHPDHSFVKLHKATDYVVNAAWDAKSNIHHPFVVCDGCNHTIRGPRYKCMHPECPDYDLCEKCEAAPVPVHPESHPMLKTKTPLRINAKTSFDPIKDVYEDHRCHRIPRESGKKGKKTSSKGKGPLTMIRPRSPPLPPGVKPQINPNRPLYQMYAKADAPAKKTEETKEESKEDAKGGAAFKRGEEYGKAVDALLASMSGMRIASQVASVKDEADEMASMTASEQATLVDKPLVPKPAERAKTPTPVGAFPSSPKGKAPASPTAEPYSVPAPTPAVQVGEAESSTPERRGSDGSTVETISDRSMMTKEAGTKVTKVTQRDPIADIIAAAAPPTENRVEQITNDAIAQIIASAGKQDDPVSQLIADASKEVLQIVKEYCDPSKEQEEQVAEESVTQKSVHTPLAVTKDPAEPNDIFTWVRHTTIHPGAVLPAGTEFTKTWQVRHYAAGSEYDFKHLRLVHKTDGKLGRACKADIVFHPEDVVEGEDMSVTIEGLKVPDEPGKVILEHWRFEDEDGVAYGQPLRIRITVEEPQSQSSGENTTSSSFVLPRVDHNTGGDSFYLPTPQDNKSPAPTAEELLERLSSIAPSSPGVDLDDASSTFSFSDVEHVTETDLASPLAASTADLSDEYDFMDETDEETEDGL